MKCRCGIGTCGERQDCVGETAGQIAVDRKLTQAQR